MDNNIENKAKNDQYDISEYSNELSKSIVVRKENEQPNRIMARFIVKFAIKCVLNDNQRQGIEMKNNDEIAIQIVSKALSVISCGLYHIEYLMESYANTCCEEDEGICHVVLDTDDKIKSEGIIIAADEMYEYLQFLKRYKSGPEPQTYSPGE